MRKLFAAAVVIASVALPVLAVEPGLAEGTLTVGSSKIPLAYSYAVGRQKNEYSNRRDDIRIIATNKPLPEGTDLGDIENSFPDGIYGVVACIDNKHSVSHVLVQYESGMFDAGYFPPGEDYTFGGKIENRMVEGRLQSKTISTSTSKLSFDVTVNAAVK